MENIISIRSRTHGTFKRNAEIAQLRKSDMRLHPGWQRLNDQQREALDLITTKIARILAGDPMHEDHWIDLAGYAELGRAACQCWDDDSA